MESFNEFKISQELVKDLKKEGILLPAPVQVKSIPMILEGKEVLVQSETGSGKTIGFAIPTIEKITAKGKIQIMVITPTRELAKQVAGEYEKFSKSKRLKTDMVYGGVSLERQAFEVKTSDIIVGTPGRLLDLLNRHLLDLNHLKFFVIDEADRLLDMGFIDDMNAIMDFMPREKQTLMFSATINARVMRLAKKYMKNPEKVILENILKRGVLKHYYYNIDRGKKLPLLVKLLNEEKRGLTLVFCNTKSNTEFVAKVLNKNRINAAAMNGNMSQHIREKTIEKFAEGTIDVLVATDVAARGIHVENISHVFNYDIPEMADTYTHRVGRTARQGKKGVAITFFSSKSERDWPSMDRIMSEYRKKLEEREIGYLERIKMPERVQFERGNFSRQRKFPRREY